MSYFFFDSSALTKRYVDELGSAYVESLTEGNNRVLIAQITQIEVTAAFVRRLKTRSLTQQDVDHANRSFQHDLSSKYFVVEITKVLLDNAMPLVIKHALRAYDAVQLAVALDVARDLNNRGMPPLVLVSADIELNEAAKLEGIVVEDPNDHP